MQPVPEKLRGPKTDWNWATYFAAKKQKLEAQFDKNREEVYEKIDDESKVLFKNVSIFVNGYTNPTAIELKYIMLKYGGFYYEYPGEHITHIIASNLAYSKALALKSKLVVKPEWITDCIKAKKLLPVEPYQIIASSNSKNQNKLTDYISKEEGLFKFQSVSKTPKQNDVSKSTRKKRIKSPFKCFIQEKPAESIYKKDFDCFQNKINNFELPDCINKKQSPKELEIEKIKHLLDDWIFFTSKTNSSFKSNKQQKIDFDDLEIFKGYLLHILNEFKDLEKMTLILKIMKRLIVKNGSTEWIEAYKEIYESLQADFYAIYDSTFNF